MTTTAHTTDIEDFLEHLAGELSAADTVRSYRSDLAVFGLWFKQSTGEPLTAAGVTRNDVQRFIAYQRTVAKTAPATTNRRLACLRRFFTWAISLELRDSDPTAGIRNVAAVPAPPRSLERTRLNNLIRTVEKSRKARDEAIVKVLRYTGIRVGELCALTRDDIYMSERKGTLTVRQGKRGKFRIVPLHNEVRQALSAYDEVRRKIEGADDHVFISQRTKRGITPRAVERLVAKYARLAGLEGVTPHVLRHSFGKDALGAGMDVVTVAALLGHENLKTTMIYARPSEDELQVAIDRIGVA
jgi:site-specific recombinase XerD